MTKKRLFILKLLLPVIALLGAFYFPALAMADGFAKPWQMVQQASASPVQTRLIDFHTMIFYIITGVAVFVTILLVYVMIRFSAKNNPVPSKNTHNVALEFFWTLIPVVILVIIAIPSLSLLKYMDRVENADMTLKVTGYQWYWGYEYPDHDGLSFTSYMIPDNELKEGQKRLLETDNLIVLPVDTNVRVLITSGDVIHAWAVPSLGVKLDAVPGRLNETWLRIDKEGKYYGQCSELCGKDHAFMPIAIKAVSKEEFKLWLNRAKVEFGAVNDNNESGIELAQAGGY